MRWDPSGLRNAARLAAWLVLGSGAAACGRGAPPPRTPDGAAPSRGATPNAAAPDVFVAEDSKLRPTTWPAPSLSWLRVANPGSLWTRISRGWKAVSLADVDAASVLPGQWDPSRPVEYFGASRPFSISGSAFTVTSFEKAVHAAKRARRVVPGVYRTEEPACLLVSTGNGAARAMCGDESWLDAGGAAEITTTSGSDLAFSAPLVSVFGLPPPGELRQAVPGIVHGIAEAIGAPQTLPVHRALSEALFAVADDLGAVESCLSRGTIEHTVGGGDLKVSLAPPPRTPSLLDAIVSAPEADLAAGPLELPAHVSFALLVPPDAVRRSALFSPAVADALKRAASGRSAVAFRSLGDALRACRSPTSAAYAVGTEPAAGSTPASDWARVSMGDPSGACGKAISRWLERMAPPKPKKGEPVVPTLKGGVLARIPTRSGATWVSVRSASGKTQLAWSGSSAAAVAAVSGPTLPEAADGGRHGALSLGFFGLDLGARFIGSDAVARSEGRYLGIDGSAPVFLDFHVDGASRVLKTAFPLSPEWADRALAVFLAMRGVETAGPELSDAACRKGVSAACNQLGNRYSDGLGVAKDPERARTLWASACSTGLSIACTNLAFGKSQTASTESERAEVTKLYESACADHEPFACMHVGGALLDSKVLDEQQRGAALLEDSCSRGVGGACSLVGTVYTAGKVRARDDVRAGQFYERGCALGSGLGCAGLGNEYLLGQGGHEQDASHARELYRKGCTLKDGTSCFLLGKVLLDGDGEQDPEEAAKALALGCDLGSASACARLAEFKEKGK